MAIAYEVFYTQKRGAAYRDEQVKSYSHYKQAVDHSPGRLAGRSRVWGDAPLEVQKAVIDKLIAAGKGAGMNVRRVAMLLAMVKIESGFNPDAAAGTTSASGLGQFINDTGRAYGLNNTNRFDVDANVKAVVKYFQANEKLAKKNNKPDVWVYKYHHDGPTLDYGGEALATGKFAKLADAYEKALEVGHALSVIDAAGAPIADATIKVEQNGKTAVMKTNERGLLPTFVASPDFGPLTIYIQKASDEFKELGQLAIDKLNSAWTIVAPKERIAVKTHVHVDKEAAPAMTLGMHKVGKGQTLSSIARAHGTTYQELAKLNNIDKPYLVFPNQMLKVPEGKGTPAPAHPPASAPASAAAAKPSQAPAATAAASKPVVKEERSTKTTHPEATVSKAPASNRIATAIAYALKHKEPKSIGRCLRYVKRALVEAGYFSKYPGIEHAKDFGPALESAGFKNLLSAAPGTNIATAPHGSVIIYAPVEKQTYSGGVISGHIEIKHAGGYVSDFNGQNPCYRTDAISLKSPLNKKYGITFKATGIWYKE